METHETKEYMVYVDQYPDEINKQIDAMNEAKTRVAKAAWLYKRQRNHRNLKRLDAAVDDWRALCD